MVGSSSQITANQVFLDAEEVIVGDQVWTSGDEGLSRLGEVSANKVFEQVLAEPVSTVVGEALC